MEILIVEDVAQDAKLLKHLINRLGYEVVVVLDPELLFSTLQSHQSIEVVFMNINMPKISGTAATRKLREELYTPIPIIGISSNQSPAQIEEYMQSGFNAFLPKPYNLKSISQMLAQLGLRRHS